MRRLFADAFYWIALLHAGDQWHRQVVAYTATLGAHHLYTTDRCLTNFWQHTARRLPISGNARRRTCAAS